jgi:tetratricopeptide (TPR) repeat protein
MTLNELERRALELAKQSDFGPEATRINEAIVEIAPAQQAAWTRLGRCHLEQRRFDDAVAALRAALSLNPANGVATNLLNEVRKRRALTPTAAERATTGFGAREFALLETLPPDEACRSLAPRIDSLVSAINASTIAERIVGARQRAGREGSKLFHSGSCHAGGTGHVYVFHHGGRWEPQFNIGWYSSPPFAGSCLRAGIGFHMSQGGRDPDRTSGAERAIGHFEALKRAIERSWRRELTQWMAANGGFLQYGSNEPAVELLPDRAVEWLLNCRNPAAVEWIFIGRWLFLDRPDDAAVLGDRGRLARIVDDTFRTLFPLWSAAYESSGVP